MLSLLHIENVAVVESVDIVFDNQLNVLTGETGAGKSIIIDALGAILGTRTSRELIRTGCDRASVRAVFHDLGEPALEWLRAAGFPQEPELLIGRDILADGRNICRIAGSPATVAQLRQLGELLVSTHGQHESHDLLSESRHLEMLDDFAGIRPEAYAEAYGEWKSLEDAIGALTMDDAEKARRIDMLSFRLNELDEAQLDPEEEAQLLARKKLLQNAEKIRYATEASLQLLSGGEDYAGAAALVADAAAELRTLSDCGEAYGELARRLDELSFSLEDAVSDLHSLFRDGDGSPGELDAIEGRIDLYYRLKRKYGCTVSELLAQAEQWRDELEGIQLSEGRLAQLEARRDAAGKRLSDEAQRLSEAREAAAAEFEKRIRGELDDLDMGRARFEVRIARAELSDRGADSVSFRFSANMGEPLKPLSKVASGGELSRIMLAVKNIQGDRVPTMIFDEVDAGVSGRAAQKVAEKLCAVSRVRQVLCVTHLAQIASMGDTHLLIDKKVRDGRTLTDVEKLGREGREREIARLTGGTLITDVTLRNASELLDMAAALKERLYGNAFGGMKAVYT